MLATTALGCGLPTTHVYEPGKGYQSPSYQPESRKLGEAGDPKLQGQDFCRDLENAARLHAIGLTRWGWVFGMTAVGGAGAGTILAATSPDDATDGRKALNASVPLVAGALGLVAVALLDRADDANDAASTATVALIVTRPAKDQAAAEDDVRAGNDCNQAIATWNDGRGAASQTLTQRLRATESKEKPATNAGGSVPAAAGTAEAPQPPGSSAPPTEPPPSPR